MYLDHFVSIPSNIQGKLCFGYEQNQQMDQALKAGLRCLEATPRDIWGIHSMAHVYEETLQ